MSPENQGKDSARPRRRLTRREVIENSAEASPADTRRQQGPNMRAIAKQIPCKNKKTKGVSQIQKVFGTHPNVFALR
ncbi:MAG: hypothetical protein IJX19_04120 [Clostridia bacterium]|nr:hypothetical protein [Clostridia bacterium]